MFSFSQNSFEWTIQYPTNDHFCNLHGYLVLVGITRHLAGNWGAETWRKPETSTNGPVVNGHISNSGLKSKVKSDQRVPPIWWWVGTCVQGLVAINLPVHPTSRHSILCH